MFIPVHILFSNHPNHSNLSNHSNHSIESDPTAQQPAQKSAAAPSCNGSDVLNVSNHSHGSNASPDSRGLDTENRKSII